MFRRILATTVLTACAAIALVGAERATFVLRNGDRVSGELTYKGGTVYTLDGKDYPSDDVVVIQFAGGDPPLSELQQLPTSSQTAEHERDLFVMRDGSIVRGKLYHFSPDGTSVVFDPLGGSSAADRRTVPASQVARVYVNARHARDVFRNQLNAANTAVAPPAVATSGNAVTITVVANRPWTDTGIQVRQGDRLTLNSSGQIRLAQGDAPEALASVDGAGSFQGTGRYPVATAPAGALIGRIGNGAAFGIGSQAALTMPANGRLFLGVNDDAFRDNSGAFTVTIGR